MKKDRGTYLDQVSDARKKAMKKSPVDYEEVRYYRERVEAAKKGEVSSVSFERFRESAAYQAGSKS